MKKYWIFFVTACALSCAKTQENQVYQEQSEKETIAMINKADTGHYEKGVAYIRLTEKFAALVENDLEAGSIVTKSQPLNTLFDDLGVVSMRRLFPYAGEFEPRTRKEGLHLWYIVEYDTAQPQTKAEIALRSLDGVSLVEGKRRIKNTAIFNDPMLNNQWGYINTAHKGVDVNVETVWKNYTTGNSNVIVSVVDGGVDLNHEDLIDNTLKGGANGSYNSVDNNYVIQADNHGTHVAGTIAAMNNNNKGVCGIAGGNYTTGEAGVKIMSCMIFKSVDNKTQQGDTPAAIKWGADHGAVISQNSWGYVVDTDNDGIISAEEREIAKNLTISAAEKAAVDYFIKYAGCDNNLNQLPSSPMKGGVVIFAAGNDNLPYGAPANYEPIISVGAIDQDGTRASFSNYGDWVDIAAPGVAIRSTIPEGYGNLQGTSMACPHVSGVAALIVSYYGGPGFTADMLKERLIGGANPNIIPKNHKIGSLVDALGSITYGSSDVPETVNTYEIKPVSNAVEFSWSVTGNSMGLPATGYVLYASEQPLNGLNPSKPGENVYMSIVTVDDKNIGDTMTGRLENLSFDTKYYVALAGYDYGRNFSELSPVKTIKTLTNNPPTITTNYSGSYSVHAHETIVIPYVISDPDGHVVTVEYSPGSNADTWQQGSSANVYQMEIVGNAEKPGNYTAKVLATDSYGLSASLDIPYTLLENQAPKVIKNVDNMIFNAEGSKFTLDMSEYIEDPDGENLKYSISITNPSVLNLNQQENILYGTTLGYGLTDVTLVGTDAKNLTASLQFKVLVKDSSVECTMYPNPVVDKLYITNSENPAVNTTIQIYSSSGKLVFETTEMVGAFVPAQIDFSSFAPGRYMVIIRYNGKEIKQNIVK